MKPGPLETRRDRVKRVSYDYSCNELFNYSINRDIGASAADRSAKGHYPQAADTDGPPKSSCANRSSGRSSFFISSFPDSGDDFAASEERTGA
ncbi:hypothetical protein EVAR_92985_1 [Eumeta japonica]|uniref:Uncharacterized protein n=1 Tax=Eumeta variegata TaxID=151549 RepID=A0A4C1TAH1_EUMVA|nr:hypothetical protein EVAR_92985_1 [Eumeta japonica]